MLTSRLSRTSALLLGLALGAGACGAHPAPPEGAPPVPTPSVSVPAGVTLTKPGSSLTFGAAASVPYVPNPGRRTVLSVTVTSVGRSTMKDFSSYQLDARTRASTPYYVHYVVKNLADGDVGGLGVPLFALTSANTLLQSSSFTNSFRACPSVSLPRHFAAHARASGCLVYLVPAGQRLAGVSFRPFMQQAGIVWKGTIPRIVAPATTHHRKTTKKKH